MLRLIGRNIQLAFAFVYAPWINLHRHFIVASQLKNSLISSRTKCGRAARVSNLSFSRLIASGSYRSTISRKKHRIILRARTHGRWRRLKGCCCWRLLLASAHAHSFSAFRAAARRESERAERASAANTQSVRGITQEVEGSRRQSAPEFVARWRVSAKPGENGSSAPDSTGAPTNEVHRFFARAPVRTAHALHR